MTILVVDDESESRTLLTTILREEGYDVRPADGAKLALAAITARPPELILLDIHMPGTDGFEVCRRLKADSETREIPLMFISATGDLMERVEGLRLGAVDFITKPFQREELLARVRTHLELGRLRRSLEKQVAERTSELRESEERFRNMADTAPVMIWVSGIDKLCTFFNKSWLDFTGRGMEQELGDGWAAGVHPADRDRCYSTYCSSFDARRSFQMEYRLRRADGEYRWVLDQGVPRFSAREVFLGYIGSCLDISDMKRAQQESLARQKLESMGLLASGIAHDFNNLLGAILACAEVAAAERDEGMPFEDELRRIMTAAFRGAEIVRELMIYAGGETPAFETVDVKTLVDEMIHLLKVSVPKLVVLRIDHAEGLSPVRANASQIRQIVLNLVSNAAEAIGEAPGEIRVVTSVVRNGGGQSRPSLNLDEGDYLRLSVSDTGKGMTAEVKASAFDPFFSTKRTGHGLGLAVVQGIVRAHGGAINLDSTPGHGTSFEIWLPCAREPSEDAGEGTAPAAEGQGSGIGGTVLIVEDEAALRFAVSKTLRKRGFTVIEASDGTSGLSLFRTHEQNIKAVLLDISLPGMTGRDVFAELQKIRPGVKVIVTSAYARNTALAGMEGRDIWRFIRKPFKLMELVDLFHKACAPDGQIAKV